MPQKIPMHVGLYQGVDGHGLSDDFYRSIARGIGGVGNEARLLKDYIKQGLDPSQAKNGTSPEETKISQIYAEAKKQSPEFTDRVEKLFAEYRLASATRSMGVSFRVITSPGSATAVMGNPKIARCQTSDRA
ncbi:hypothetical protein [Pseudomonas chlororaphis]|uniref:hypothetical protein n=1 Tax=Pseudomonas chlororaphis TaxID=587753 RepID=UPI000F579146|nr:hypothetical protein [Pseudomonas chlororaphis]